VWGWGVGLFGLILVRLITPLMIYSEGFNGKSVKLSTLFKDLALLNF
jgi:hypothetical protein